MIFSLSLLSLFSFRYFTVLDWTENREKQLKNSVPSKIAISTLNSAFSVIYNLRRILVSVIRSRFLSQQSSIFWQVMDLTIVCFHSHMSGLIFVPFLDYSDWSLKLNPFVGLWNSPFWKLASCKILQLAYWARGIFGWLTNFWKPWIFPCVQCWIIIFSLLHWIKGSHLSNNVKEMRFGSD